MKNRILFWASALALIFTFNLDAAASRDLTDLLVTKTSGTTLGVAPGVFGADESSWPIIASVLTIKSFAVTGVSTANPAVITFSGGGLNGVLQNGDTVTIAGVTGTGCTAINTTAVVAGHNDTEITLTGVSGSGCTYSDAGTMTGTGNGTAYIYANNSGSLTAEIPVASAGLAGWTTGSGVVNQVTTPAFPGNGVPLASCTIVSGAWGTCTDQRRFMSARSVTAGTGITVASGGEVAIDTALVPQLGGANVWTGTNDSSGAASTFPAKVGANDPATCTVGQLFVHTAGSVVLKLCTATNTWSTVGP